MIDLLNQSHSLKNLEIVDGDILCFEKKLPEYVIMILIIYILLNYI